MAAKDPTAALAEITSYFNKRNRTPAAISEHDARVFLTQACALIDRLAPPGSAYRGAKDRAVSRPVAGAGDVRRAALHLEEVDSILQALMEDYANGRIELPPDLGIAAYTRIEQILSRFHKVVRQLSRRHGGRTPLAVGDEYDVQDLLRALFSIDFEDVRPEEWTPSYAGSSGKRMDFLFKKHAIVVELKKTRDTLRDKEVGEQFIIDIAHYKEHPNCGTLVCFVYDPDELIANPVGLKEDLESLTTQQMTVSVIICQA
jgi:hypothetical protein